MQDYYNENPYEPQDPNRDYDHDRNNGNSWYQNNGQNAGNDGNYDRKYKSRSSLRSAAMILAVISLISFLMVYISVPLGAIAIILALLSKGQDEVTGKHKTIIALAAAGMCASTALTGFAFYRVTTDPVLKKQMQQMLNYYTSHYLGESTSEAFPWLFDPETSKEEKQTEVTWSDDLLNDHDRLVDYFLTPHGDGQTDHSTGTSNGSSNNGSTGDGNGHSNGGQDNSQQLPIADILSGGYT